LSRSASGKRAQQAELWLAQLDERQSKIVELRFFVGMSEEETGNVLGISARTVKRDWRAAKAWLFAELSC
jgi:RNA polymerase sigma factor (sigma-70 family)